MWLPAVLSTSIMPERRFAPRRVQNALDRANGRLAEIPVDVVDHGDHLVVKADLPGYRKQEIEVTVNADVVRIEASPGESSTRPDRGIRRRVVRLSEPVKERRAKASFHNGVLRIRAPKRNPGVRRSIPVE